MNDNTNSELTNLIKFCVENGYSYEVWPFEANSGCQAIVIEGKVKIYTVIDRLAFAYEGARYVETPVVESEVIGEIESLDDIRKYLK